MDASASKKKDAEVDKLYDIYLKLQNLNYPSKVTQKKSVIKYARLPDIDLNTKGSWPQKCFIVEPRFRRIITIESPKYKPLQSLRSDIAVSPTKMASDVSRRKIVTIEEDGYSLHPKFSQETRKTYTKLISRAIATDATDDKDKQNLLKKISSVTLSKTPKEVSSNSETNIVNNKKENDDSKYSNKSKYLKRDQPPDNKNKMYNEHTATTKSSKSSISSQKLSLSKKNISRENNKEISETKNKFYNDSLYKSRKLPERTRSGKPLDKLKNSKILLNDIKEKNKPVSVICVPIDQKLLQRNVATEIARNIIDYKEKSIDNVDSCIQVIFPTLKDSSVGTDLLSNRDQITETDKGSLKIDKCSATDVENTFDSLNIPNVRLIDSKIDIPKEINDAVEKNSHETSPLENTQVNEEKVIDQIYSKSASCVITRATLTYTAKQKIDFHVVGNDDVLESHLSSSPFPLNVVSMFQEELKNQKRNSREELDSSKKDNKSDDDLSDMTSINSSCVFDDYKLVKPSKIISTIKVSNSLLQSDYISDQFQRELNFIDSFFESLQYLENCSLSEKSINERKVEDWINGSSSEFKNLEFGSFLSKFENEVCVDNSKTMASKSLCLLNLLIRDEQRRAKNLLFVLKMREDALKDFTKSQILWLENKKRQENTDISTLKKKQRGALLKLQHECGEMQRMRKALLTLSEKRKLALMKTKKNIELKLRNSVDVEQIILGKKKLKRSTSGDRIVAPLKCFELSSSGCDDSTTSRPKSNTQVVLQDVSRTITSAEKFVQTGDSTEETVYVDQSTDTSDENFVVVDGSYLNILFHNMYSTSKTEIFSSGKQYEVNKEALKSIVQTSNMQHCNSKNDIAIEELMEKVKNPDVDRSTTPSTARSLVEEFDQIYKDLAEEDRSHDISSDSKAAEEFKHDTEIPVTENENDTKIIESEGHDHRPRRHSEEACTCEPVMVSIGTEPMRKQEISVAGPLPVPAGEAAVSDDVAPEVSNWLSQKSSIISMRSSLEDSSSSSSETIEPSLSRLSAPVLHEAEELRRQQLAIEREIKALEQQQCQLLALREIPDKPPPPYTPPFEPRQPKQPRKFTIDEISEEKIDDFISQSNNKPFDSDPFDIFVNDFCQESIERRKVEKSEKYWDTCNLLPLKSYPKSETIAKKTATDLREVLTSVQPTVVSGVGARRSDHIDDILFAEWRRCEPEWTSLHTDEIIVKNQVFEGIFQKILSETIDEYKKTVVLTDDVN